MKEVGSREEGMWGGGKEGSTANSIAKAPLRLSILGTTHIGTSRRPE